MSPHLNESCALRAVLGIALMLHLPGVQLNTTVVMVDTTPFSLESATGNVSTMTCVSEVNKARRLACPPVWHAYSGVPISMCHCGVIY